MTLQAHKPFTLSALWQRIKRLFGQSDRPASAPRPDVKFYCRVRSLERCYQKDCAVEATRKRLERAWEDVST
ncbi:MAG: hypothetical protein AAFQ63_01000 [Cyanobacteria bacterium J06621_11]